MPATIVGPIATALGLPGGVSSAYNVAAAGVLKATAGILVSVSIVAPGSSGNLTLNDCTTTAAAGVSNEIFSAPFSALSAGKVIPLRWPCSSGITVSGVPAGAQFSISFT